MKEFIICAAIYINDNKQHLEQPDNIEIGFVVSGRRHGDCYATISAITGIPINNCILQFIDKSTYDFRKHQGFITSLNRYVDRKEAWKIALENNQIIYGLKATDNGEDSILISENLYADKENEE